jgi:hypothetical protein
MNRVRNKAAGPAVVKVRLWVSALAHGKALSVTCPEPTWLSGARLVRCAACDFRRFQPSNYIHPHQNPTPKKIMKLSRKFFVTLLATCCLSAMAFAAGEAAPTPTGVWKWTQQGRQGGQGFERKIKLEYKDGNLTGEMLAAEGPMGPTPATPIKDGSFKDGVVVFSITREFNGNSFTVKYEAKLEGDTLKGTSQAPGRDGGEPQKRDWTATREK